MIIGLTGPARCGKDTAANYIQYLLGYRKLAFADPLKQAAAILLHVPLEEVLDGDRQEVLPDWGFCIREFLQKLGTEGCRDLFRDDFWIVNLEKRMGKDKNVVISDVRFNNEAQWVRNMRGRVIHISRPNLNIMNHRSEEGVIFHDHEGDILIQNDGDIVQFKQDIFKVLDRL